MNYKAMTKADLIAHIEQIEQKQASAPSSITVTATQIFPFKEGSCIGRVRAFANIVLSDQFQVRGLRVTEGPNGLFVSYPCDPFFKGEESRYVTAPITRELREHIEATVLAKYQESIATPTETTNG